ncbi:bifunctional alpha/beta hydrolase/class I SAM-dependent methyltransferase [Hymenobacter sp. BT664]|uniref:Bifunctional alpha/beta hydrolase/class I SAM-dependent methyltransferase n=1 Tax=Hymenobacter montanus TaxID=2771359 RepID=A0A927BGA2_9BACT|nr:bifunctional alpha/beta hydrolase/class I SAM-dependent methyltransferase [Hymenobacter montanus]MBD2769639.1 bifunctional alpha/beta hydrolase/class I SAM-dependent methyltransferase [Hymenobacter montanus]
MLAPSSLAHPARTCNEQHFPSFDATSLFYRHWPAAEPAVEKKAIVLFHRGHEHGERMAHLVDELALPDHDFFAWDARGLGHSPGKRGYADNFGVLVKDVDAFVRHIAAQHGIATENVVVIGQSFGAVVVATWVHDYAPRLRGLVLASPAFKINLIVPGARQALALLYAVKGNFFVNSYVKATQLTHDEARIASYNSDPLITRPISVNILLELNEAADRIIADAAAIHVPTQVLVSGDDQVVYQKPQQQFFDGLSSPVKEIHVLDGFYHDTLGERDRERALVLVRDFITRVFATPPAPYSLLDADQHGHTQREFSRLSAPPTSALARGYWALGRFWIKVGGQFSAGIKNGLATGFDSGSTLDYVYRNRKQGLTPVGKLVDGVYLNSIGWRGIRIRKAHLEKLIGQAIDLLRASRQPVHIVDIAAGHGRYILEALAGRPGQVASILLRDYSPANVEAGRRLIAEKGLANVARFELGDAFDQQSLAGLQPGPTLAVVSGLYELFGDNRLVGASLAGLAEAMAPGGYLLYTNQPWHPQLEMIARSLTSHREGRAWVMRRRVQAEMDELLAQAGFEKLDQLTDQWGIFSVSLARRK